MLKIYVSDVLVPLTRVQFAQRQFHNRCKIGSRQRPDDLRWCTIPVSLPDGRGTLISDVTIANSVTAASKTLRTLQNSYGRTPGWSDAEPVITEMISALVKRATLAQVTLMSMCGLLRLLGWRGQVFDREVTYCTERNLRLARLTADAGCDVYHCGPVGLAFLRPEVYHEHGITPVVLRTDRVADTVAASQMDSRSTLDLLCRWGLERTKSEMERSATLLVDAYRQTY